MQIVIYDEFLRAVLASIEKQRPEILGAHTLRYRARIPFPWNANKSLDPIPLKLLEAELDYDARGSRTTASTYPERLELGVQLDAAALLTQGGIETETKFGSRTILHAIFGKLSGKKYPLLLREILLEEIEPIGLRKLLSWVLANSTSDSLRDLGISEKLPLGKKAKLKLQRPVLAAGCVMISAVVEV